ncbi:MAG: methyltransferase domain-containing protein [Actinomycetota bacterium]
MSVHDDNQAQAEFWTIAGDMWTAARERFDQQAGEHGVAAIDALEPQRGEHVIDIGCGAGSTTVELARRVGDGGRVTGLDISPTMVEGAAALVAQHELPNVTLRVADAMVDEFAGDADALYSRFGVMFFADAASGFANMRTALKPGGRLGFVCWQSPADNPWASTPLRIAAEFVDMPFGADPTAPGPFSLADADRLRSVLDSAGYDDVEIAGRSTPVALGSDLDDTADFIFQLMPPVAALAREDPAAAGEFRERLKGEFEPFSGDDGVMVPSATWIVTAVQPE